LVVDYEKNEVSYWHELYHQIFKCV